MRDNYWLETKMEALWAKYFSDVTRLNRIHIHFGRKAKRRLASIRQLSGNNKYSDTSIQVTGFYRNQQVPEYVVDLTIAHELCHYAHGFASPLPQFSRFPHKGDIVDDELRRRGLGKALKMQEAWLKENWNTIVGETVFKAPKKKKRYAHQPGLSLSRLIFKIGSAIMKF